MFKLLKGKTGFGIVLGIVGILLDSGSILTDILPDVVAQVFQAVATGIVIFGLFDAAKQEQDALLDKVKSFMASHPFVGYVVEILSHALESMEGLPLPDYVFMIGKIVGAVLITLGLRQASVEGRMNTVKPSAIHLDKYTVG